jgi:hypothetical protein
VQSVSRSDEVLRLLASAFPDIDIRRSAAPMPTGKALVAEAAGAPPGGAPVGTPGESTGVTGSEPTNSGGSGSLQGIPQGNGTHMSTIHFTEITTSTPEQFIAGLTDFGPGRAQLFANSSDDFLKVHAHGPGYADVTEGSGGVWERLHYDWSDPNHIVLKTTDSNLWGGASGHTYTLHHQADGATTIDVSIVRQGKNLKGRLLGIVLGLFGKSVLGKPFHNSVNAIEARNLQALITNNVEA